MITTKLLALLQFLLALGGCSLGATSYSNHIANGGHDVLVSKAQVQDGVARFDCKASDNGWCHYTLYPDACAAGEDCALAPLQRFKVARGDSRQIAGLQDFRLCVGIDDSVLGPDCTPVVAGIPAR
ncbi:MAG: hypothetical protein IT472_03405 [Thermomonas sp.]|uniref:hypothetical protein n=1 Tax=Thermomonas sp. TaxID=1971895 RepID=UPI0026204EBF|nr:hypothetical protein [Thermomonas sp.]MCC7096210.1 hypothetical protein [Thermomonas sp.]